MEDTLLMRRHGRGREKKSDGEEDKDAEKERSQNDMEMILPPAAYNTKHFHPVIFSELMS